ncbi:MAG TPA: NHL repeat-containing protein [Polyangiaceae bacterium]|jgi:hypothetical protein|nr:NHL repeat-containing protein [Polyangiaceae bacterium]
MPSLALTDLRSGIVVLPADAAQPPLKLVVPPGKVASQPYGVAHLSDGRLAFADRANHRVVAIGLDGADFASFGTLGSGVGELRFPSGVATGPGDRIYVADTGNHRIVAVDSMSADGWESYGIKGGPTGDDPLAIGRFAEPIAVVADAAGVIVADPGAARVVRLSTLDDDGWSATAAGEVRGPAALALRPNGAIVVADLIARQLAFLTTPSDGVTETFADPLLAGPMAVAAVSDERLIVCVVPLGALVVVDRSSGVWSTFADRSLEKLGVRRPTSICLLP